MDHLLSHAIKKRIGKRECLFDVSALNPYIHEWKIKVKILRKFTCSFTGYKTFDLILVDDEGQKIHAVMGIEFEDIFSMRLTERSWISLSSFSLSRVIGTFRPTDHRFMIHWKSTTWFRNIQPMSYDNFFKFDSFEDIKSGSLDTNICGDLIGRVVAVGNQNDEEPPDNEWNEIFFDIENIDLPRKARHRLIFSTS
ncbi:unnamed protein product [Arabidopsis lyrata]|nr:unnamed protein product [Arabidopsis lyrata]